MKQSKFYPTLVLGCICLVVALLLSGINMITSPIITDRANDLADKAKTEVLPGGANFKNITADFTFPTAVTEAYSADGGFVFRSTGSGRNGEIVIMVGVDTNGKITGTKIITEAESKGYKEKVYAEVEGTSGKYTGQSLEDFSLVSISGSTLTSVGFGDAVKAALQAYVIASGGSVDLRGPEQILQENCNAALGTEGKTFTLWFKVEVLNGIDKVYESEDGRVYIIGESFIGVKNGAVVTADVDAELQEKVLAADAIVEASVVTEVTERPTGVSKISIKKVYKTDSGNYLFELEGSGFSAAYHGETMKIKVSISADGKIIDVITLSQAETKGYGDKCQTEEYYESWIGITSDKVVVSTSTQGSTDPGVISGSTYTTAGYQTAIKAAFTAFNIYTAEGGND